jgi:hypothetical protein
VTALGEPQQSLLQFFVFLGIIKYIVIITVINLAIEAVPMQQAAPPSMKVIPTSDFRLSSQGAGGLGSIPIMQ